MKGLTGIFPSGLPYVCLPVSLLSWQKHKVVILEDLAARFRLPAQEAINRVENLEKVGRITGVIDDRGKFIYIETEEMEKVSDVAALIDRWETCICVYFGRWILWKKMCCSCLVMM